MDDALIASLRRAVEADPADVELRLHHGELLLQRGDREAAVVEAGALLARLPGDERARSLMREALATADPLPPAAPSAAADSLASSAPLAPESAPEFDWSSAEAQLADLELGNVVLFGEDDGTFAELRSYLKRVRRL